MASVIEIDALLSMADADLVREAFLATRGEAPEPGIAQQHLDALAARRTDRLQFVLDLVQEARRAGREVVVRFGSPAQRYLSGLVPGGEDRAGPAVRAVDISGLCRAEDEEFVRQCYIHLLGKQADEGGLRYYAALLRGGTPKVEVLSRLIAAARGQGETLALRIEGDALAHLAEDGAQRGRHRLEELLPGSDEAFVARLYRRLLGKEVDPDGLAAYRWMLTTECSRLEVVARIMQAAREAGRPVAVDFDASPEALREAMQRPI